MQKFSEQPGRELPTLQFRTNSEWCSKRPTRKLTMSRKLPTVWQKSPMNPIAVAKAESADKLRQAELSRPVSLAKMQEAVLTVVSGTIDRNHNSDYRNENTKITRNYFLSIPKTSRKLPIQFTDNQIHRTNCYHDFCQKICRSGNGSAQRQDRCLAGRTQRMAKDE